MSPRSAAWLGAAGLLLVILGALGWGLLHSQRQPALLGHRAPELTMERLDGQGRLSLSDLRGRPVLLNFWASWCEPCRQEAPVLAGVAERRKGELRVVGVNVRDRPESARAFVAGEQVPYPVGQAVDAVPAGYQTDGLPTTYFLDGAGLVVAQHRGPLNEEILGRYLELLGIKR